MNARRRIPSIDRRTIPVLVGLTLLAGLAWVLKGDVPPQLGAYALRPDDGPTLALGQQVYHVHCAACHGAQRQGQSNWRARGPDGLLPAPPHDASGHTWHHDDETLFRITKFGVARVANIEDYATAMPVFEGVLSDEEIVAVLSWIKAQWPAEVRARHDQVNQHAR
jgi:mono/diheme cytochrome c family protein